MIKMKKMVAAGVKGGQGFRGDKKVNAKKDTKIMTEGCYYKKKKPNFGVQRFFNINCQTLQYRNK